MKPRLIPFCRSIDSNCDVYLNPEHIVVIEPHGLKQTTIGMVNATAFVVDGHFNFVAERVNTWSIPALAKISIDGVLNKPFPWSDPRLPHRLKNPFHWLDTRPETYGEMLAIGKWRLLNLKATRKIGRVSVKSLDGLMQEAGLSEQWDES